MPTLKRTSAPRNPVARSPLMRKGGVHEKTAASKRRQVQKKIDAELDNWREAVAFELEIQACLKNADEV